MYDCMLILNICSNISSKIKDNTILHLVSKMVKQQVQTKVRHLDQESGLMNCSCSCLLKLIVFLLELQETIDSECEEVNMCRTCL